MSIDSFEIFQQKEKKDETFKNCGILSEEGN